MQLTTKYVAFLRGINSGKNPTVKMKVLRKAFEDLGFTHVRTILASGNVLFETAFTDEKSLEQKIEEFLPLMIGFKSEVIVRTIDDLYKLMLLNPFKASETTSHIRSYVTFVKGIPKTNLKFPAKGKGYTILGIFNEVVCSVVDLSDSKTPYLMQVLDKEFGRCITTRSWNTIERILKVN
jgi:uncharacterized protein (DUF1697 family)